MTTATAIEVHPWAEPVRHVLDLQEFRLPIDEELGLPHGQPRDFEERVRAPLLDRALGRAPGVSRRSWRRLVALAAVCPRHAGQPVPRQALRRRAGVRRAARPVPLRAAQVVAEGGYAGPLYNDFN